MSDERFIIKDSNSVSSNYPSQRVYDNKVKRELYNSEIVDLLNKQDFAIEVKQKYIEKLEKQLEKIPKSIRDVWLE